MMPRVWLQERCKGEGAVPGAGSYIFDSPAIEFLYDRDDDSGIYIVSRYSPNDHFDR